MNVHTDPNPVDGVGTISFTQQGMTLRDWFAGQALNGLMADSKLDAHEGVFAEASYALADAMLVHRAADKLTGTQDESEATDMMKEKAFIELADKENGDG